MISHRFSKNPVVHTEVISSELVPSRTQSLYFCTISLLIITETGLAGLPVHVNTYMLHECAQRRHTITTQLIIWLARQLCVIRLSGRHKILFEMLFKEKQEGEQQITTRMLSS